VRIKYFNRYELKYILPQQKAAEIEADLMSHVEPDSHSDGRYPITSLYYDTPNYKAYWDKIEGHRFRRKVRIRIYEDRFIEPETNCFVEIKQRTNKSLQKKRIFIPYKVATALCNPDAAEPDEPLTDFSEDDQAIKQEIQYLAQTLRLQPACVVSYDRAAFNGDEYDAGLRITFDTNLKCRTHALSLLRQDGAENQFFLPPDWCIMEVKINNRVPYWLSEILSQHRCTLRRISKYCAALEHALQTLQQRQISY